MLESPEFLQHMLRSMIINTLSLAAGRPLTTNLHQD
jgi:hypothetical protein